MQFKGYDGLLPGFAQRLQALTAAVEARGGHLKIGNGRRTNAEQAALYRQKPGLAAPPGHSNHERGTAADMEGDLELAHQLAPQFGLFFPMSYEPWHIEPVGGGKAFAEGSGSAWDSGAYTAPPADMAAATPAPPKRDLEAQLLDAAGMLGSGASGDSTLDTPLSPELATPDNSMLGAPGVQEVEQTGLPHDKTSQAVA